MKGSARILTPVLILTLIASCNKTVYNNTGPSSSYYATGYYNFQPFRAFANTGEITDTTVLNRLYTRESPFFTENTINTESFAIDSIYFSTPDTAVVYASSTNLLNNPYIAARNGNVLQLTCLVPTQQLLDTSIQTEIDSTELLYTPLLTNGQYLGGGYFMYNFTARVYATQVSSSELAVPCMITCFQTPTSATQSRVFNNRFNVNFGFGFLPAGDTLCVRELTERMVVR